MDKKCVICGKKSEYFFNIDFNMVPICNQCANAITQQQVEWLIKNQKSQHKVINKECYMSPDGKHHKEPCSSDPLERYCCKYCGHEIS